MNILVTGAKGMVGTALCNNLRNIRDNKNRTWPNLQIEEIYEYDLNSTLEELDEYCRKADFVFNLAGVNRPENPEDFMKGNFGFASDLLNNLKKYSNKATIMLSSSIQATLAGRFGNSEYGRSKKAGEELFFDYAKETGAKVAVYRFPNLRDRADRSITVRSAPSAGQLQTMNRSLSMIEVPNWSCFTSTIWWRECSICWSVRNSTVNLMS